MHNKLVHLKNEEGEYFGEIRKLKEGSVIREGFGRMKFKDGSFFEGEWAEDEITGQGKLFYKSGNVYKGTFYKNKKQGYGEFFYKNSGDLYRGEWVENKKNGEGVYFFKNGERFEGMFKNDFKHGPGFKITNNVSYKGCWNMNFKEGKFCFVNTILKTQGYIWYRKGKVLKFETCENDVHDILSKILNMESDLINFKENNNSKKENCKFKILEIVNDFPIYKNVDQVHNEGIKKVEKRLKKVKKLKINFKLSKNIKKAIRPTYKLKKQIFKLKKGQK